MFEGAIRNFPEPDVEKDNVNYLAGVREIGVRSEYTDGRDMPRLLIRSVEFEGPFTTRGRRRRTATSSSISTARTIRRPMRARSSAISPRAPSAVPITAAEEAALMAVYAEVVRPADAASRTA